MTLNGVIALILLSLNEFVLQAYYVTAVVEDRPLQNIVFHFWPKRGLSAIAKLLV